MTEPGGRQWSQVWATMTSALASAAAEVRAEGHLATDAVVAFVDGELSLSAHERATRHLANCRMCTAEVAAQRQASTAVRDAGAPVVPQTLLAALHDIPQSATLPPGPDELAVTDEGQLVVAQRPLNGRLGSTPPLGSSQPLGSGSRLGSGGLGSVADSHTTASRWLTGRFAQGAGVVVSGLVLGVLVLAAPTEPPGASIVPGSPSPDGVGGDSLPVKAELGHLPYERQDLFRTTTKRQVGAPGLRAN
jgi:anti-sigma factor RsiW